MPKLPLIESGWQLYLFDGGSPFGAVREVLYRGRPDLLVNVEGGGDFIIPLDTVDKVASQKVLLSWQRLPEEIRDAIRHALDHEEFSPPGEEVELVPPPTDDDSAPPL